MMFPWMKEQLTEAWNSRRSSKSSKKSSANNSDDPLPSTSLAESFTISVIGMNTSEALEWLVEHEDDPEDTEELQLPLLESILEEAGPSSSIIYVRFPLYHIVNNTMTRGYYTRARFSYLYTRNTQQQQRQQQLHTRKQFREKHPLSLLVPNAYSSSSRLHHEFLSTQ
ncbi:unnamed protein product [Trichogramma brassicae]|uniref:Uncharacterized protein n=1 Tax=Trichogramma brassicae TaxID=86971 RepID=A0A6H5IE67_9HYME|nr:unnamed protein product [Trichogramma brassicae]